MAERTHGRHFQHEPSVCYLLLTPDAHVILTLLSNFADVFKTPGKLRGKTPRTARKRDALAPRQPLTDIFAPNAQIPPPPAQTNAFYDKVAHFRIAEDQESAPQYRPTSRGKSPQRVGKPGNTDSGYHGMTEDEMDVDPRTETATASSQQSDGHKVPLRDDQARPQPVRQDTAGGRTSEESFISAKEDLSSRNASREELREENDSDTANLPEDEMQVDQPEVSETPAAEIAVHEVEEERMDEEIDEESPRSPSDTSSPGKPLQRKSSFTFSALPAREPLTAKRSIGFRDSQIDAGRGSVLGRSLGGKSLAVAQDDDESFEQEKPEEAKMHNKTSTQSLHERIMMLGKTKEPRTSKSIPQNMLAAQPVYPQLPSADGETNGVSGAPEVATKTEVHDFAQADDDDDDDDWIAPSKPTQAVPQKAFAHATQHSHTPVGSPVRPGMHQKSISTNNIPSPSRPAMALGHQKSQSVSNPSLANAPGMIQSTTPAGTPNGKNHHDGALSTSKNMLRSAFKSAKGLFASSASTSAAAKLEARNHSPAPQRSPKRDFSDESKTAAVFNMPGALYSQQQFPQSPTRPTSVKSASPSRKTRSSTESDKKRQKEMKAQQKAAEGLEKVREKERQKVAKQQEEKRKAEEAEAEKKAAKERQQAAERPVSADSDSARDVEMPPPPPPKSMLPAGKLRAPGRLIRPTREQPAPSRPAPVSIRVTSQSQRLGQPAQPTFSKSQHESMAPPPPPKTGLRTASAQGNVRSSTAPNNARVKALEAAARKKEADEKAAQKKIEQKREMERKRAAKAEEERRAEDERRAAEQARVQEAKLAAQRKAEQQAADTRKREQQRLDQQRQQEEAQKARAAHELAEAIQRERAAAAPPHARGDVGGTLRQLAKNTVAEQHARNAAQPNPAKPAKRIFQPEDDEQQYAPPQRPGMQRAPPSYQQSDAKRRRTNEEQEEVERHSVMAPPKRPSNMRKVSQSLSVSSQETVVNIICRRAHSTSSRTATRMRHRPLRTTRVACSSLPSRHSTSFSTLVSLSRVTQARRCRCRVRVYRSRRMRTLLRRLLSTPRTSSKRTTVASRTPTRARQRATTSSRRLAVLQLKLRNRRT